MSLNTFWRGTAAAAFVAAATLVAPTAAFSAEKVTFLVSWLPGGDEALAYVAAQKGLFAAEGLDVTIMSARGSSDVVTKLASGVADIGEGGLAGLLQARAKSDVPVKAVMSIFTKQPDSIFTTEGSGIKSLQDLVGKQVATATFTSSNVVWPLILKKNGIDPDKITLTKVDPGALAPMLATGKADATINWSTVAPLFDKALSESSKKLVILPWSKYGFEGYGLSIFASDKTIKERPEVLRKFLKAYVAAAEMAAKDPKIAATSIKAMVPELNADVAEQQFAATLPLTFNEISKKDGLGHFDNALLAKTWEWTAKSQNLPLDKIDPENAVDRSFYPQ